MKLTQPTVARLGLPAGKSDAIYFDDDMPGCGFGPAASAVGSFNIGLARSSGA